MFLILVTAYGFEVVVVFASIEMNSSRRIDLEVILIDTGAQNFSMYHLLLSI